MKRIIHNWNPIDAAGGLLFFLVLAGSGLISASALYCLVRAAAGCVVALMKGN